MSDTAPTTPNDPAVMQDIVGSLQAAIDDFNTWVGEWRDRVDSLIVRAQNAASARQLPDGGVTGSVPESGPGSAQQPPQPVDTTGTIDASSSTIPTGSSTGTTDTTTPTSPPEDTTTVGGASSGVTHDFIDPSGDDTISDPSGDDHPLA